MSADLYTNDVDKTDSLTFSNPSLCLSVRGVISDNKISYDIIRIAGYMTMTLIKRCYIFEPTMKSM